MSYKNLPEHLLERLSPVEVRNYLNAASWVRITTPYPDVRIYRTSTESDIEVILPDNNYVDYVRRMAELVDTVATHERRNPREVLSDLLSPPSDIIRYRYTDVDTEAGYIPLARSVDIFDACRRSLIASACSASQPQRQYHPRLQTQASDEFVSACNLSTEQGSFVVKVQCPITAAVDPDVGQRELELVGIGERQIPSFTRSVTTVLMKSLNKISDAFANDRADDLLQQPATDDVVVSANLCDALVEMQPQGDRSLLQISVVWARNSTFPTGIGRVVELRKEYFNDIERIGQSLKPIIQPQRDTFAGHVVELRGVPGNDGRPEGVVDVVIMTPEGTTLRAAIQLGADDYAKACNAHRDHHPISVNGLLHRGRRMHRIEDAQDFVDLTLDRPPQNQGN